MKARKGIDGKLDIIWSKLVKLRAGMKCEIENCKHKPTLNSHHVFSRKNSSTRWDLNNGLCLCIGHHTMSSKFSAHGNPIAFTYWLEEYKGSDWIDALSFKAHSTKKWSKHEKEELLIELQNELKIYG
tara:strand:+ start:12848 stop:13231 length:384 start_codon:yes stop_codon:yes gene_type:complete